MAYHDVDLFFFSGRHSVRMAPLPLPYYLSDREAAEEVLRRMPVYASRMRMMHLFWDPDDYHDFSFLKDPRRRDEILSRLPGLVLESDVCGARVYRFTRP